MSSVAPQEIIAPQTAAVVAPNHGVFHVTNKNRFVRILAPGLAGIEEVDLFYSHDLGTTWTVLADAAGTPLVLSAIITSVVVEGPVYLGVLKDTTTAAVGVFVEKGHV